MGFFSGLFKAIVTAAAVAASVYFLGPTVGLTVSGTATAFISTAALTAAATYTISSLLAETPKNFDLGEQLRGQLVTTRSPTADARVVYGQTRLGGNMVFVETTGENRKRMTQVITIAGHEIQDIVDLYANDTKLNDTDLSGSTSLAPTYKNNDSALRFNWRKGTVTQTAMSLLQETKAEEFRFLGIAVIAIRLNYFENTFPTGVPNFTATIKGKKVFDPRTNITSYSNNAALCIRDYLIDTDYGLGASASEIDEQSFEDAADICDEDVELKKGGTEKRYTINGAFSSAEKPKDVLAKMLTACGGKLSYVGGKWTLRVAAYRAPTVTLTEDDIVGAVTMQASQSRRDIFNAVKGTYSEPETLYQPASFPPITNLVYETEDGERIWKDVQFPFTTSAATCQRLAKISLETARQQISFTMSCKLTAFALQPGDTVNVNFERYGWNNKVFEVYNWTFNIADSNSGPAPKIDLVLRETASGIYDWNSGQETEIDLAPNTDLPDPFEVTPPGIDITDELAIISEEVLTKLVVNVTGENTFQVFYEVQARKSGDTDYTNLGQASGNRFELPNVEDGATYEVRARSVNSFGVRSEYTTGFHQVVGKTTPPSDVTNFSMNIVGSEAYFTWSPVPDLDLSHYKIRHSRLTASAEYSDAVDLVFRVARPGVSAVAPAMTGTYFIKAIDKLGNASVNAASIVAVIEDIKGLNVVETITESPVFSGIKVECSVVDNKLVLDTATDFDDISGLFDDLDGNFDGGGGTTSTLGTYDFDQIVDLGAVYTSRVTAYLEVGRVDYVNSFDDADGFFDDRLGDFDGDPNQFDDTNVELQVSVTDDNPAGTPAWSAYRKFFVGDYKARGLRFRAVLTSNDEQASPTVEVLQVTVDMPDRVTSGDDITSGTAAGGKVVNFVPAFKAVPALGIAAQNLTSGDYYEILSKTASGFTIRFKNSGGTVIDRTFDYVAKGYGELAA